MRGAQFDPVVGSPAKRFNPSSSSFSPFSHLTEFTSTYTTPDPVEKSAPRLSSNFILSGGAESRALYRRGVNARVEVEEEEEEAGSRYVLVQSLPADATRNDLENLVVSLLPLPLHNNTDGISEERILERNQGDLRRPTAFARTCRSRFL